MGGIGDEGVRRKTKEGKGREIHVEGVGCFLFKTVQFERGFCCLNSLKLGVLVVPVAEIKYSDDGYLLEKGPI